MEVMKAQNSCVSKCILATYSYVHLHLEREWILVNFIVINVSDS